MSIGEEDGLAPDPVGTRRQTIFASVDQTVAKSHGSRTRPCNAHTGGVYGTLYLTCGLTAFVRNITDRFIENVKIDVSEVQTCGLHSP